MEEGELLRVVGRLEREGIEVWIDGGWGVDALLERRTREHDDLDLVADLADADRIVEALGQLGYEPAAGGAPLSVVLVDGLGHQVDVHPVTFDEGGGGVYRMGGTRSWVYPAEGFSGRGTVGGRPVRCLTPETQVLVHAGYELGEKDYLELHLLRERFGVEVPAELLERVLAAGRRERPPWAGVDSNHRPWD